MSPAQQPGPDHPVSLEAPASIAIVGAGPLGLEAALYGKFLGYKVTVLERGEVADNVADWQHVTMFTPFSMLHSSLARQAIETQDSAHGFPDNDDLISGATWRDTYLKPLAHSDLLRRSIQTHCEVISIARSRFRKQREIGSTRRLESAFTVVWRDGEGRETADEFDFVIDASGSYGNVSGLGPGGSRLPGEDHLRSQMTTESTLANRLFLKVPDFSASLDWDQQRVLVLGDGFSAATSIQSLMDRSPSQLIWLSDRAVGPEGPLPPLPNDPLPAREKLSLQVNGLAQQFRRQQLEPERTGVQFVSHSSLVALHWDPSSSEFQATVRTWQDVDWDAVDEGFEEPDDQEVIIPVDRVIANIGYRPDLSITRELQVHLCYATEGPMALAKGLAAGPQDCMATSASGSESIATTEPRFFVIGIKSYGRLSHFLYRTGLDQVRDVYRWIVGRQDLDLYQRHSAGNVPS